MSSSKFALPLISLLLLLIGCEDDNNIELTDAPEIPPSSTFVMDFDSFPGGGGQSDLPPLIPVKGQQTYTQANFNHAAFFVGFWNLAIAVNMVVPVAAYGTALQQTAEQQPDGSWHWAFDFGAANQQYSARLECLVDEEGFNWDMYISQDQTIDQYHWFSGWSNLTLTEGTWTLNRSPEEPEPYIGIEWERTPATDFREIRYTNIIPDDPANGGYIWHGITAPLAYDAFYDIYGVEENRLLETEWNRDTQAGHVRDEVFFEDSDWHCWDEELQDIDCP
jgi:hypothetical protein